MLSYNFMRIYVLGVSQTNIPNQRWIGFSGNWNDYIFSGEMNTWEESDIALDNKAHK